MMIATPTLGDRNFFQPHYHLRAPFTYIALPLTENVMWHMTTLLFCDYLVRLCSFLGAQVTSCHSPSAAQYSANNLRGGLESWVPSP